MNIVKRKNQWCLSENSKDSGLGNDRQIKYLYKDVLQLYLEKYFEGYGWSTRKEPYIHFKHLFRKYMYDGGLSSKLIASLEKKYTTTSTTHDVILNSKNKRNLPIHPVLKEDIQKFLDRNWELPLQTRIKYKIEKVLIKDKSKNQIAKECLVHDNVIDYLLSGAKVPYYILKQMEKEL